MASTSIPHRWKYDVFVSFRGEDIRKSFMDHMFSDFKRKGIRAFRDDRQLPKGEAISPHLYQAIEKSRFLIVVFSKNYASSSWCLRELVKILECTQSHNPKHELGIIFYDVKPDVVRHQTDSYAKAINKHQRSNRPEVNNWKRALFKAANLSGWDLQDTTNGYESEFIDRVSKEILNKLCARQLDVGVNLVGMDSHLKELNMLHIVKPDKVNMIGICGISGIGKTTLVKAIYNLMYVHFEESFFCEDVQGVSKRQGLAQVQQHMIGKIIMQMQISSVGEGVTLIKKMTTSKPILLVLDNVDDHQQLMALAGSPNWFCPGSLIIFTSEDKQLLNSQKVDRIYEMESLKGYEALELFSLYAFRERHPTKDFENVASQIGTYLQGHPLALIVIGRLLYQKPVDVWEGQLHRLQTSYPNPTILQKLRPSFNGLVSDEKTMFCDIACAFIGENKDFAASVLDSSHCSANAIIAVLADKFLITVSANRLQMHELIQSMAREIMREEFRQNHRRLWISSEDYEVLNLNQVTEKVEVLVLLLKENCQNIPIDGLALTRMKNLRILKICFPKIEGRWQPFAVNFPGRMDSLSNNLRLLYWHGLPLESLPLDFYLEKIVTIDLSYSHIKHLWTTSKCFPRLKFMKLRYCLYLTSTPDFTDIANLEELILEGCKKLVKVHPSVGILKKLLVLNMRDCTCLKSFPSNLEMDSLQILILSGCLKLDKLPEDLGRITSLTELHADRTAITEVPSFVSSLINLESLSIGGQGRVQPRWWTSITSPFGLLSKQQHPQRSIPSLAGLHMLKSLNLSYCNLEQVPESIRGLSCLKELNLEGNNLEQVPNAIGGLSYLIYLTLSGNNFTSLPGSLSQLYHLYSLRVKGCKKLEVLPKLPPSLSFMKASDCTSLREVSGSAPYGFYLFRNCPKLLKNVTIDSEGCISKSECLDSSITSQGFIHQLSDFLGYLGLQTSRCKYFLQDNVNSDLDIVYHANSIPEWFKKRSRENQVKVELPSEEDWCYDKNFRGYATCVVFKCKNPFKKLGGGFSVKNFDGASIEEDLFPNEIVEFLKREVQDSYIIWLHYIKSTEIWKKAKKFVTFSFFVMNNEDIEVKECGVRLICDEDIQQEAHLSMLQALPTPTQHGGALQLGAVSWSW